MLGKIVFNSLKRANLWINNTIFTLLGRLTAKSWNSVLTVDVCFRSSFSLYEGFLPALLFYDESLRFYSQYDYF